MTSQKTIIADMQAENDNLRQQLAESESERLEQARLIGMSGEREAGLLAEIERLKGECLSLAIDATPGIQLAASQAREQQLREAMQQEINYHFMQAGPKDLPNIKQAIAIPQDTTALESMIAKAGEVMREKAIKQCVAMGIMLRDGAFVEEVRDLPGVTLDDIK